MNPGRYDRLITISNPVHTNVDGDPDTTYTAIFSNVPCFVKAEQAGENTESDKMEYQQTRLFQIPYPGDNHAISGLSQITFDSKIYNVKSIVDDGRQQPFKIMGELHV